jgi:hypothetical protein
MDGMLLLVNAWEGFRMSVLKFMRPIRIQTERERKALIESLWTESENLDVDIKAMQARRSQISRELLELQRPSAAH